MSDIDPNFDPNDDLHTQLIKEVWLYCYYQERFERFGFKQSARFARNSLRRIRELSRARYAEIQEKNKANAQNRGKKKDTDDN